MQRKNLGVKGENLAFKYLKKIGYHFIDRNFSCSFGEIDLIFQDKKTLVFIEVKTRLSTLHGKPEEAVTKWKINSIIKTGQLFKVNNPKLPDRLRIDVIAIIVDGSDKLVNFKHIKNITG